MDEACLGGGAVLTARGLKPCRTIFLPQSGRFAYNLWQMKVWHFFALLAAIMLFVRPRSARTASYLAVILLVCLLGG